MGLDRIDQRGLLTDEEMARAMERAAALLLGRLGLAEPHIPRYMQDFCIMIADHMREVLPTARRGPHKGRAALPKTRKLMRRKKTAGLV